VLGFLVATEAVVRQTTAAIWANEHSAFWLRVAAGIGVMAVGAIAWEPLGSRLWGRKKLAPPAV
jgi:hypothetical protein